MPRTNPLKYILLSALVCLLPWQSALLAAPPEGMPDKAAVARQHADSPPAADDPSQFAVVGGRGPKHCAMAIGVMIGGAIGFWGNPILGASVLRFGLMATALHCG